MVTQFGALHFADGVVSHARMPVNQSQSLLLPSATCDEVLGTLEAVDGGTARLIDSYKGSSEVRIPDRIRDNLPRIRDHLPKIRQMLLTGAKKTEVAPDLERIINARRFTTILTDITDAASIAGTALAAFELSGITEWPLDGFGYTLGAINRSLVTVPVDLLGSVHLVIPNRGFHPRFEIGRFGITPARLLLKRISSSDISYGTKQLFERDGIRFFWQLLHIKGETLCRRYALHPSDLPKIEALMERHALRLGMSLGEDEEHRFKTLTIDLG